MRGLLEKDIRLLMHSKQTFVCFIASAVVLGVAQKSTFMLGYLPFLYQPSWFRHFLMMRWIMDLLFCLHYLLTEKYMSGKNMYFVWVEQLSSGLLR